MKKAMLIHSENIFDAIPMQDMDQASGAGHKDQIKDNTIAWGMDLPCGSVP
jgi:hypothetical protein